MPAILPLLSSTIHNTYHPRDIMKHVLKWYMYQPKNINDTFQDDEISFIYDNANSVNISELKNTVASSLEKVLKKYFPDSNITVDVEHEMVDEVYFNLHIAMMVNYKGINYLIDQKYSVDKDGNLEVIYEGV